MPGPSAPLPPPGPGGILGPASRSPAPLVHHHPGRGGGERAARRVPVPAARRAGGDRDPAAAGPSSIARRRRRSSPRSSTSSLLRVLRRHIELQAYIQFFGDLLLITALVHSRGRHRVAVLDALPDRHRRRLDSPAAPGGGDRRLGRLPALREPPPRPLLRVAAAGEPSGAGAGLDLAAQLQPGRPLRRFLRRRSPDLLSRPQRHPRRARAGGEERGPGRPPGRPPGRHRVDHQRSHHDRPRRHHHQRQPGGPEILGRAGGGPRGDLHPGLGAAAGRALGGAHGRLRGARQRRSEVVVRSAAGRPPISASRSRSSPTPRGSSAATSSSSRT